MPPGASRLLAAAAVCLVSLGLVWSSSLDFGPQLGLTLPYTYLGADGYYYTTPSATYLYYGADGVALVPGFRSDVRAILVPAVLVLGWAATHRTDLTRRLARGTVVAMGALFLVACSRGASGAAISMVVAIALALPVVWPEVAGSLSGRSARRRTGPAHRIGPSTGSAF